MKKILITGAGTGLGNAAAPALFRPGTPAAIGERGGKRSVTVGDVMARGLRD